MATLLNLNFTRGLNDSLDPDRLLPEEVETCLNVRPNATGNIVGRDGQSAEIAADASSFPNGLSSIFEATLSDGTTRCIATSWSGSDVQFWYKNGSVWTELTTSASLDTEIGTNGDGDRWRWVFFNDLFIGVKRGGFKPVKWDGATANAVDLLDTDAAASGLANGTSRPTDVAVWNRRLAFCQNEELFISDAEDPETWDIGDSNVYRMRGSAYGEEGINCIYQFQGDLYIFKKDSEIWALNPGEGNSATFTLKQIASNIGCDAPFSIQNLGRDLIWAFRGEFNTLSDLRDQGGALPNGRISQKISRTYTSLIPQNQYENMIGIYNADLNEYMCAVAVGENQSTNNYVLVLNTFWSGKNSDPSWWIYDYNQEVKILALRPSQSGSRVYSTNYTGALFQLNTTDADNGNGYMKKLKSRRDVFNSPHHNKYLKNFYYDVYQEGSFNVAISIIYHNSTKTKSFSFDLNEASALWDYAVWDVDAWGGAVSKIAHRFIGKVSRDFQMEISTSVSNNGFGLNKIILEYDDIDEDMQQTIGD